MKGKAQMTLYEILKEIHKEGYEIDIYKHLSEWILVNNTALTNDNAALNACLRAIKKINNGKNNAIDALCERDKEV